MNFGCLLLRVRGTGREFLDRVTCIYCFHYFTLYFLFWSDLYPHHSVKNSLAQMSSNSCFATFKNQLSGLILVNISAIFSLWKVFLFGMPSSHGIWHSTLSWLCSYLNWWFSLGCLCWFLLLSPSLNEGVSWDSALNLSPLHVP